MDKELTVCCETSQEVCAAETASHGKLSEAELSEAIRGKILKYLSSGRVLALAIFKTLGSVMYAFGAVGLVLLTVMLALVPESAMASVVVTYIVAAASYIFFAVYFAVCAKALYKIRGSARRDGAAIADELTGLASATSAYRIFYYINAGLSAMLVVWSLCTSTVPPVDGMSQAYNMGYTVGTVGYIIGTALTSIIAMTVGVVLAHLFCSSLMKLFNRIKERLADPLVPGPTKHRFPAVISFISAGYTVLSVGFAMLVYALLGVAVVALVGSGAIDMGAANAGMVASIFIIGFIIMALMIAALAAPIVIYNILLGVTVLKYNKLEKEIAALIADNSEESTCPEQAPTV